ncbi:unnamed protein product [Phaeothamnion confervicola]
MAPASDSMYMAAAKEGRHHHGGAGGEFDHHDRRGSQAKSDSGSRSDAVDSNDSGDEKDVGGRELTAEEKLDRSRERNRDHSRKSRQRKKVFIEGLQKQVKELGAYRMLVEQAHDLISMHSADDKAVFLYASSAYHRALGMDPQELIGLQLGLLVHPEDAAHVTQQLHNALVYGEVAQVRYRIRRSHKRAQSVETSFRLVPSRLIAVTRLGQMCND